MSDLSANYDPFDESLWGELARVLLIGTSVCSAAFWAFQLANETTALVMLVTNILVVGIAVGSRFAGWQRLVSLLVLVVGIIAVFAAKQDPTVWWRPIVVFSPIATVGALFVLVFRDGLIAIRKRTTTMTSGKILMTAAAVGVAMYMVVIPSIGAFLEMFRERPRGYVVEDLTPLEVLRIRSAKVVVFGVFAYAGACVGSFLNVVAASAPRGEPIALRSSACPKCGTLIRRIDNLPIFSYLHLRGCCRDCDAEIPIRYFNVELVGFAIFGSLFLYELITGAANVPGFRHYYYAGILWIILYAKWSVIGIYFFHCALFSCLLTLGLIEQNRLRAPRWMTIAMPVIFASIAIISPAILTVSLGDQTPFRFPDTYPDWVDRALTSGIGGVLGLALGNLFNATSLRNHQSSASLVLGFALVGISLGWQASITIAILWLALMKLTKTIGGRVMRPRWLTPTTFLFVVVMLHHPAWKWLASQLSF
jgi:leader peptidase (prepilin peptidase)/N-methyltransferase